MIAAQRHARRRDREPSRLVVTVLALVFVAGCYLGALGAVWLGYWWATG